MNIVFIPNNTELVLTLFIYIIMPKNIVFIKKKTKIVCHNKVFDNKHIYISKK